MKRLASALLILLALAGCSASTKAAIPAVSPAATTASPTPAVLTAQQARAAYLKIASTANDSINRARRLLPATGDGTYTATHKFCTAVAAADRKFNLQLMHTRWPAADQEAVNAVVHATAGSVAFYTRCSRLTTASAVNSMLDNEPAPDYSSQVELLREQLGLPSAP